MKVGLLDPSVDSQYFETLVPFTYVLWLTLPWGPTTYYDKCRSGHHQLVPTKNPTTVSMPSAIAMPFHRLTLPCCTSPHPAANHRPASCCHSPHKQSTSNNQRTISLHQTSQNRQTTTMEPLSTNLRLVLGKTWKNCIICRSCRWFEMPGLCQGDAKMVLPQCILG